MKVQKIIFISLIFSISIFYSCGTTKNLQKEEKTLKTSENADIENQKNPEENNDIQIEETYPNEEKVEQVEILPEKIETEILPPAKELEVEEKTEEVETELEKIEENTENITPLPDIADENSSKTENLEENIGNQSEISETIKETTPKIENLKEITESSKNSEISNQNSDNQNQQTESEEIKEIPEEPLNFEITEETEEDTEKIQEQKEIKPSRSVKILNYQYLDIVYPGQGWVYLGQIDNKKDFIFNGRKLGGTDTTFTIRSRKSGNYILHFYKNDNLTGEYIDDYLEVQVSDEKSTTNEHVICPPYEEVVPKKFETKSEQTKGKVSDSLNTEENKTIEEKPVEISTDNDKIESNIEESVTDKTEAQNITNENSENNVNLQNFTNNELLENAKKYYNEKNYESSKKFVDRFLENSVINIDEALFLNGQILEAKSPIQNIKNAIESYDLVVKNYPQSKFWEQAKKRSIYLKRFYININ